MPLSLLLFHFHKSWVNKAACGKLILSKACSGSFSKTTGKYETKWWASHLISIIHFQQGAETSRNDWGMGSDTEAEAVRRTCSVRWWAVCRVEFKLRSSVPHNFHWHDNRTQLRRLSFAYYSGWWGRGNAFSWIMNQFRKTTDCRNRTFAQRLWVCWRISVVLGVCWHIVVVESERMRTFSSNPTNNLMCNASNSLPLPQLIHASYPILFLLSYPILCPQRRRTMRLTGRERQTQWMSVFFLLSLLMPSPMFGWHMLSISACSRGGGWYNTSSWKIICRRNV